MVHRLFLKSIITLLILEISNPLEHKAAHKNNLINKFCIASLKSKLKFKDKQKLDEISHFTCECFFKQYKSGNSLKDSRIHCKDKASEKYNL
mgnify:CR=1 FL=1